MTTKLSTIPLKPSDVQPLQRSTRPNDHVDGLNRELRYAAAKDEPLVVSFRGNEENCWPIASAYLEDGWFVSVIFEPDDVPDGIPVVSSCIISEVPQKDFSAQEQMKRFKISNKFCEKFNPVLLDMMDRIEIVLSKALTKYEANQR